MFDAFACNGAMYRNLSTYEDIQEFERQCRMHKVKIDEHRTEKAEKLWNSHWEELKEFRKEYNHTRVTKKFKGKDGKEKYGKLGKVSVVQFFVLFLVS